MNAEQGRPTYTIRRAVKPDIGCIMALLAEASTWLRRRGYDQWQGDVRSRRAALRSDVRAGSVHVLLDGDRLIGSVTVDRRVDPELWPAESRSRKALYVHRMVVARSHAGRDIGRAMLAWADGQAETQGYEFLRLDAWATNRELHEYYVKRGFVQLSQGYRFEHRGSGATFERFAGGLGTELLPKIVASGSVGTPYLRARVQGRLALMLLSRRLHEPRAIEQWPPVGRRVLRPSARAWGRS